MKLINLISFTLYSGMNCSRRLNKTMLLTDNLFYYACLLYWCMVHKRFGRWCFICLVIFWWILLTRLLGLCLTGFADNISRSRIVL